jgi:hypothetical protein
MQKGKFMTNAIVYAMYSDIDNVDNLLQWRELLYSVKTLRQHNKEIPVKVYLSPSHLVNNISMFPDMNNLEIIGIDNEVTHSLPNEQVAKWLDMKYNASFHALENYGYDRVLMIDADTIYQSDPNVIFDKYNSDIFYACPDNFNELFELIGSTSKFMNDGVVIVPNWAAKIKNELIAVRNGYVQELMDKFNGKVDKQSHVWVYGICWASFQYGIFNYLTKINKPLGYFGKHDVATLLDFHELRDDQKTTPPIVHYWSVGYKDFLPEEYLIGLEDKMYKSISSE